jgi:hypothetical protein
VDESLLEEADSMTQKTEVVTVGQLMKELENYEKELKQKLVNLEIDVEEAVELYLAKRDETENLMEQGRRQDGKYRRKLFDEGLEGFREIESGVLQKVRLDLPKLSNQQLLMECSKDLRSVSKEVGGMTRWLAKWGGGTREEKLQARYYQAMTKLLTVLARQNQVVINLLQAQAKESE